MNNLKLVIAISLFLGFSQNAFSSHDHRIPGFGDLEKKALAGLLTEFVMATIDFDNNRSLENLRRMTDAVGELQVTLDLRYKALRDMGDRRTAAQQDELAKITRLLATYRPKFKEVEQILDQASDKGKRRK